MQKIKIALCDKDKFYCERFAAYMMNHKAQEIELNIIPQSSSLPEMRKWETLIW